MYVVFNIHIQQVCGTIHINDILDLYIKKVYKWYRKSLDWISDLSLIFINFLVSMSLPYYICGVFIYLAKMPQG